MRAWIGKAIIGIGVLHSVFGIVFLGPTLAVLWSEGLLNTVRGEPDREFAFWFLAFGLLSVILGAVVDWAERKSEFPPAFFGWSLLAFTIAMVAIMPVSGGWLLLVPAVAAIWRSMKRAS